MMMIMGVMPIKIDTFAFSGDSGYGQGSSISVSGNKTKYTEKIKPGKTVSQVIHNISPTIKTITVKPGQAYTENYLGAWANSYLAGHKSEILSTVGQLGKAERMCIAPSKKYMYSIKPSKENDGAPVTNVYYSYPGIDIQYYGTKTDTGWTDVGTDHYVWQSAKIKGGTVSGGHSGSAAGTLYHSGSNGSGTETKDWDTSTNWQSKGRVQYVTCWGMDADSFVTFSIQSTPWDKFQEWSKTYIYWKAEIVDYDKYWKNNDSSGATPTSVGGTIVTVPRHWTGNSKILEMTNKRSTKYVTFQTPDQGHTTPVGPTPPTPNPNPSGNNNNGGGNSGSTVQGQDDANWMQKQVDPNNLYRGDTRTELVRGPGGE